MCLCAWNKDGGLCTHEKCTINLFQICCVCFKFSVEAQGGHPWLEGWQVCAWEHRRFEVGGVQLSLLGGTGNTRTGQSFFPLFSCRFSECSHPVWRTCCVNFIKSNKIVQLFKLYLHMNIQRITSRSTSPDTKFTHSQPIRSPGNQGGCWWHHHRWH